MARAAVGRRLLVIDEDAISRVVLKQAYALRGHAVAVVATASEGIDAVARNPPEVVVYDWSFRNQSGIGLAHKLREACPEPLVIVSLTVMNEVPGFRAQEGIDDYLVKPVTADVVEKAFEAVLERNAAVTPNRRLS